MHIIEDDPAVRDAARELVEGEGRRVFAYEEPAAFFAAPPPGPRDIVVLDIHFPTGSGVQVAEQLKRQTPEIKIVVISGIRGVPFARALSVITPAANFRKPLDGAAFAECIKKLAAST